jgi:hypothetical protein
MIHERFCSDRQSADRACDASFMKREARDEKSVAVSSLAGYVSRGTCFRVISPQTVTNNVLRANLTQMFRSFDQQAIS